MLKILTVIGTRPEAIKLAPVVRELARYPEAIRSTVCSTGQHRDLLGPVFELFAIRPDLDLGVMRPRQSLARLTARLLEALDALVERSAPDWILAQGDTTTVLASALVAFYRRVRFGHVEAGLRTGSFEHPFPEEANRSIADRFASLLFAPTERARRTLLEEGCDDARIVVTGNTVIDALLFAAQLPWDWSRGPLSGLPADRRLVLVTAHRRESFGAPLREICTAIRTLAERFAAEGVHFVYPVHPNPEVRGCAREILGDVGNVSLLEPLDYAALVQLMKRAELILTDSGGLQEEAPALETPVLVLRQRTDRPEAMEAGVAKLVGTRGEAIVAEATALLRDPAARAAMATGVNPYGDGKAARRIVDALLATAEF